MAEKPKLLRIVTDMRSKGLSDNEIRNNLSQMSLSDDEVDEVMEIAEKDVYAKFKGEMSQFIQKRIKDNRDMIDSMVEDKLEEEMGDIEDQVYSRAETKMGEFARKMNEKIDNLSLSTKKIREENVKLRKKKNKRHTNNRILHNRQPESHHTASSRRIQKNIRNLNRQSPHIHKSQYRTKPDGSNQSNKTQAKHRRLPRP